MITRFLWLMPNWFHDAMWAVSGWVIMATIGGNGVPVKLQWKKLVNGRYV